MAKKRLRAQDMIGPGLFDEVADIDDIVDSSNAAIPHAAWQFMSFGSGSSGNCSYLGIEGLGGILIDAGIEARTVLAKLQEHQIPVDSISGLLLTHDHTDHIKALPQLVAKMPGIAVYCTEKTLKGWARSRTKTKRAHAGDDKEVAVKEAHRNIVKEHSFRVGPFSVIPFEVSHDGTDNVGFCISNEHRCFVAATDMGCISERADYYMRQANCLMIESNYDAAMLATGPYPPYLKRRISSPTGHLNNMVAAQYLANIWSPQLSHIFLCHLSYENNRPEIAMRVAAEAMRQKGIEIGSTDAPMLSVLPRCAASELFRIIL